MCLQNIVNAAQKLTVLQNYLNGIIKFCLVREILPSLEINLNNLSSFQWCRGGIKHQPLCLHLSDVLEGQECKTTELDSISEKRSVFRGVIFAVIVIKKAKITSQVP